MVERESAIKDSDKEEDSMEIMYGEAPFLSCYFAKKYVSLRAIKPQRIELWKKILLLIVSLWKD